MTENEIILLFSGIFAGAAPIVTASLGEMLTEKAGIINLSLDGTILLSAMGAFAISLKTGSIGAGIATGALIGAAVALIVGLFSIHLGRSQVAVGFVLTLMTRDLAYFLGNPYSRIQGPQVEPMAIPFLKDIPYIGPILFRHNLPVYFSMFLIFFLWWYIHRTPAGLRLKAVGENPAAAWARGIHPKKQQMLYTLLGGLLVGLAGAMFSLLIKPGWGRPQGAEGTGWIALAIVIFGGWEPIRVAAGAYLFSFLQVIGIYLQGWVPSVPAQVFQVAPFPLMIFTLLFMSLAQKKTDKEAKFGSRKKSIAGKIFKLFYGKAPSALGRPYRPD